MIPLSLFYKEIFHIVLIIGVHYKAEACLDSHGPVDGVLVLVDVRLVADLTPHHLLSELGTHRSLEITKVLPHKIVAKETKRYECRESSSVLVQMDRMVDQLFIHQGI